MTKGLVHVRIDDRLIHGQVAVYWCNAVNATRIMVANDEMYQNEVQKAALRLVVPAGLKSSLLDVEKAAPRTNMSVTFKAKEGIITSNPTDLSVTAEGLANADA